MIASQQTPTEATREIPATLQSPRTKLVYLYLRQGTASVDAMQDDLEINKISLYPILQTLTGHELVERTADETFRCC